MNVTAYLPPAVHTRTEGFDAGLGLFANATGNHENGNDFDFVNSTNAGGTAGELGGVMARSPWKGVSSWY